MASRMSATEDKTEKIKCIFCDKANDSVFIEESGYKGRKCSQCGLIYISPRPTFEQIVDLYGHDSAYISAETHIAFEHVKRRYARHNLKIIQQYIETGELLEIGASAGFFLDEARNVGFVPHGIELNPVLAEFMRNTLRISCEENPLSFRSFGNLKFDLIYHCDVVSHFYDPIDEFRKINAKLKPGGIVAFETGNLGDVAEGYLPYIPSYQYPDHLFFFSESNIRELLSRTEFSLLSIDRFSILPQLRMMRARSWLSSVLREQSSRQTKSEEGNDSASQPLVIKPRTGLRKNLNDVWRYAEYLVRYKLGRVSPKQDRPQTIIVVARKG